MSESVYAAAASLLNDSLASNETKNRDAICEAFIYVLETSRDANASDIWHHVIYRLYCEKLTSHKSANPSQSWVRASGDALELALQKIYTPVLAPHGIAIEALISRERKRGVLEEMGLLKKVGDSKLDVALFLKSGSNLTVFGGVHVKASLAERVSDDIPASRAMMKRGYFSPLWTLDVKSFPPPRGDLINRGELGAPRNPSEKRKYIERHGDFDNCYTANSRSVPTKGKTKSGKKVVSLCLLEQPDSFASETILRAELFKSALRNLSKK